MKTGVVGYNPYMYGGAKIAQNFCAQNAQNAYTATSYSTPMPQGKVSFNKDGDMFVSNSITQAEDVSFTGKKKRSEAANVDRRKYNEYMAGKIHKEKIPKTNLIVKNTDEALKLLKQEGGVVDKYIESMLEKNDLTLGDETYAQVRGLLCKYLDTHLDIYSYDRIGGILKGFDEKVQNLKGKTAFFIPEPGKSYDILMALYKKQNQGAEFVSDPNKLKGYDNVVILDDCSVSGNSIIDVYQKKLEGVIDKDTKVQAFFLTVFDEGLERIKTKLGEKNVSINRGTKNKVNIHHFGESKHILPESDFFQSLSIEEQNLLSTFLQIDPNAPRMQEAKALFKEKYSGFYFNVKPTHGYEHSGVAVLFDYMGPNNNSPFATIMLKELYDNNIKYNHEGKKIPVSEIAIKKPDNYFETITGSFSSQTTKTEHYITAYRKFVDELVASKRIKNTAAFDAELERLEDNYLSLILLQEKLFKKAA